MRTIFEDTTLKDEMEESRVRGNESKYALPFLWLIAMVFLAGTWGVYRWADTRPAIEPPPPPVSLDDPKQTAEALRRIDSLRELPKSGRMLHGQLRMSQLQSRNLALSVEHSPQAE